MTVPFWFKTLFKAIVLVDNTSFNNFVIKSVYEVLIIQNSFICDHLLPESIAQDRNTSISYDFDLCTHSIQKQQIPHSIFSFANVVYSLCFVIGISRKGQCMFRESLHLAGAAFTFSKTYLNSLKEATPIQ